jgi:hypothetical protein
VKLSFEIIAEKIIRLNHSRLIFDKYVKCDIFLLLLLEFISSAGLKFNHLQLLKKKLKSTFNLYTFLHILLQTFINFFVLFEYYKNALRGLN